MKDLKDSWRVAVNSMPIRYKTFLDELGEFESAVVISSPDSREGNTEVDESNIPEVTKWWKENVGSQSDEDYTNEIIQRFDKDDKLKLFDRCR